MAIEVIVDGYNLIGSRSGLRGALEKKRKELLNELQEYQKRKALPITVVFDGGGSGWGHEVRERVGGITVIFSQQGQKADDVIIRLAREVGSGCIVVTSDREVQKSIESFGAVPIYSGEFHAKLRSIDREVFVDEDEALERPKDKEKRGNPRRLSKTERKRRERLKKL